SLFPADALVSPMIVNERSDFHRKTVDGLNLVILAKSLSCFSRTKSNISCVRTSWITLLFYRRKRASVPSFPDPNLKSRCVQREGPYHFPHSSWEPVMFTYGQAEM